MSSSMKEPVKTSPTTRIDESAPCSGRQRILRGGGLAIAAAVTLCALAGSAHAQNIGKNSSSTGYGGFGVNIGGVDLRVNSGSFTHDVYYQIGNGTRITHSAGFLDPGGLCNWRIDFLFYDTNNHMYWAEVGQTHTTCDRRAHRGDLPWTQRVSGFTCATLLTNGIEISRVCLNLSP